MEYAPAFAKPQKAKEEKGTHERERERDVEWFYSYKILRDTYIASPLAMPSRRAHLARLTRTNTGAAFPPSTSVISRAGRGQKRGQKVERRRETENLYRKEPVEREREKQDRIDVSTLKCKSASRWSITRQKKREWSAE